MLLPDDTIAFNVIRRSEHPTFEGMELIQTYYHIQKDRRNLPPPIPQEPAVTSNTFLKISRNHRNLACNSFSYKI